MGYETVNEPGGQLFNKKVVLLLSTVSWMTIGCDGLVPTREEIVAKYPDVEQASARPENPRVLCPFLRMLERAGLFGDEAASRETSAIPVAQVAQAAREFGCASLTCGSVAWIVAAGQGLSGVDIEKLHDAGPISHDCGLTFARGEAEVSEAVREATLDRFAELADESGNLTFDDIRTVKLEICEAQGVKMTPGGEIEMKVMFAYLGGVENGSVALSDVSRFLHATMPETKSSSWVDANLVGQVP